MSKTSQTTLQAFTEQLASRTPTPGGGAAAAVAAAIAAATARMVVSFSEHKASLKEHHEALAAAGAALDASAARCLDLADADADAYAALNALLKQPRADRDPERLAAAAEDAAGAPSAMIDEALAVLRTCERLLGRSNAQLRSDLAVAAALAEAAAAGASHSVRINLPILQDTDRARHLEADLSERLAAARTIRDAVERHCTE